MVRRMTLPPGWYPRNRQGIEDMIGGWRDLGMGTKAGISAGIVPHAGWFFSGELMYNVLRLLSPDLDLVIVAGGHMSMGAEPAAYFEEEYETPAGNLNQDREFFEVLRKSFDVEQDTRPDNTVEVVLPLLKYLLPEVKIIGMRLPPDTRAAEAGEALFETAEILGRKAAVIGSTDLTHYGPNYGFTPPESRRDPAGWVKERDSRIIEAVVSGDIDSILYLADRDMSACSAGGAASAGRMRPSCCSAGGCLKSRQCIRSSGGCRQRVLIFSCGPGSFPWRQTGICARWGI